MDILAKARTRDTNVSDPERILSVIGGGSLLAYGITRRDKAGIGLAVLGGVLMFRGTTGHCDVYQAIGVSTRNREGKGTGRGIGVPYELGFRVDHVIEIDKPREEVYGFWRNLENLPRFMANLEKVRVTDEKRSRWTVKAPAGMTVSWEAEIINEIPNELIGWRSLPGSQVDVGGSVQFRDSASGGTELKIELQYNPPAGTVGRALARLFGEDPAEQIREDLGCFKELLETGTITTSRTSGKTKPGSLRTPDVPRRLWDRDKVAEASEESFPASDAPAWTPGRS